MASVERVEQALTYAEGDLTDAKAKLETFEGGQRGRQLTALENKLFAAVELSEKEKKILEKLTVVKKKLEDRREECDKRVGAWGAKLREMTSTSQPGNDFVTRALGT